MVEFVGSVIAFTYRTAARLIDAMIEAGLKVADMLAQALAKSYFVFRKMVNGVLKALGPVGDILDWVLTQAAGGRPALPRGRARDPLTSRRASMRCSSGRQRRSLRRSRPS